MTLHVGMGLCRVLLWAGAGDSFFHSDLGRFSILVLTDLIELFWIPRVYWLGLAA